MRAECTLMGVITLPSWRRLRKYTSFMIRPRGFSIGARYVAIAASCVVYALNTLTSGTARR